MARCCTRNERPLRVAESRQSLKLQQQHELLGRFTSRQVAGCGRGGRATTTTTSSWRPTSCTLGWRFKLLNFGVGGRGRPNRAGSAFCALHSTVGRRFSGCPRRGWNVGRGREISLRNLWVVRVEPDKEKQVRVVVVVVVVVVAMTLKQMEAVYLGHSRSARRVQRANRWRSPHGRHKLTWSSRRTSPIQSS